MGKTTLLTHIAARKLAIPPNIDVLLCEQGNNHCFMQHSILPNYLTWLMLYYTAHTILSSQQILLNSSVGQISLFIVFPWFSVFYWWLCTTTSEKNVSQLWVNCQLTVTAVDSYTSNQELPKIQWRGTVLHNQHIYSVYVVLVLCQTTSTITFDTSTAEKWYLKQTLNFRKTKFIFGAML